jgi:hypothetical protein
VEFFLLKLDEYGNSMVLVVFVEMEERVTTSLGAAPFFFFPCFYFSFSSIYLSMVMGKLEIVFCPTVFFSFFWIRYVYLIFHFIFLCQVYLSPNKLFT